MGFESNRRLLSRAWRATAGRHRRHDPRVADARTRRRSCARSAIAEEILQTMGFALFVPLVAACPGCGRTTSTVFQELARDIQAHIRERMAVWRMHYPGVETLNVAVMGCIVNGPGELETRRHRHFAARYGRNAGRASLHRRQEGDDIARRRDRRGIHPHRRRLRHSPLRRRREGRSGGVGKPVVSLSRVMAGLVPAIHAKKGDHDVDARDKRGHDARNVKAARRLTPIPKPQRLFGDRARRLVSALRFSASLRDWKIRRRARHARRSARHKSCRAACRPAPSS